MGSWLEDTLQMFQIEADEFGVYIRAERRRIGEILQSISMIQKYLKDKKLS